MHSIVINYLIITGDFHGINDVYVQIRHNGIIYIVLVVVVVVNFIKHQNRAITQLCILDIICCIHIRYNLITSLKS